MQKKLTNAVKRANAKPVEKPPSVNVVVESQRELAEALQDTLKQRDEATAAVLNKLAEKNPTITLDAAAIGKAVGKEIAKIRPPVINIPERVPVSYQVTSIERNRKGEMVGAMIVPVAEN